MNIREIFDNNCDLMVARGAPSGLEDAVTVGWIASVKHKADKNNSLLTNKRKGQTKIALFCSTSKHYSSLCNVTVPI
jgi:hypothetical protein